MEQKLFGTRKNKGQPQSLGDLTDAPAGMFKDPAHQFAEIYGSATVNQNRLFIVAILLVIVVLVAVAGMYELGNKSTAVPWIVEVNAQSGVVNRPVKIESITPNKAVVKAELAKFTTNVFTIDKTLTPRLFKDANVMTSGLGTTKFADFRSEQNVNGRMAKETDLTRIPAVTSVDISQPGIAFIFLTTEETKGSQTGVNPAKWRVTLKYEFQPPQTEAEILTNPLGLFVVDMNITQEGKTQ